MNNLAILNQTAQTMSSREIAKLCDKEHKHVVRDIQVMFEQLNIDETGYAHFWTHPQNGQTYREFLLDKDLTLTLVSGYSAVLRYRIIQRWQQLEQQNKSPALPNFANPVEAARAWADAVEKQQFAIAQVAELKPQAEALKTISHAKDSLGIREAGKVVGLGQNKFVEWCLDINKPVSSRFLFRDEHGVLHAYQHRISQGMMTEKMNTFIGGDGRDRSAPTVRFTPKGIAHIAKMLKSKEVA